MWKLRTAIIGVLFLSACAGAPSPVSQAVAQDTPEGLSRTELAGFEAWRRNFRVEALSQGISPETFDRALGSIKPNPDVMAANERQPEFTRPVWEYLDGAVSAPRIERGRELLVEHQALFARIQARYGVDPNYLLAIWGLESSFGANIGHYNLFEALATLAFDGRRQEYGRTQLLAALKIVERGDKPFDRMVGSWAGAMGQTQFIPTTYLQFAVDEDGDNRRDLFDSVPDILASTANYLSKSGWRRGESWGQEVRLPAEFEYGLADPEIRLPYSKWRELGVTTTDGQLVPDGNMVAGLLVPAGHEGPSFLTLPNFSAILKYNNSTSYALAIGHLADRLIGHPPIAATWPREERPLSLSERRELQDLLNRLGYNVGEVDGIVGARTREGIRDFQRGIGTPADGFATATLLEKMRLKAGSSASSAAGSSASGTP